MAEALGGLQLLCGGRQSRDGGAKLLVSALGLLEIALVIVQVGDRLALYAYELFYQCLVIYTARYA